MLIKKRKNRQFQTFKRRKKELKTLNHSLINDFKRQLSYQNGADRLIDNWQIIDIHKITPPILDNSEFDFWCYNGKAVYLLRLRNNNRNQFSLIKPNIKIGMPTYLIAEISIELGDSIGDELLKSVLMKFDI